MRIVLWMALAGCAGGAEETDTDEPVDTEDTYVPCTDTWIEFEGPEAPRVGDSWTVYLYCDGALMMGAMILRFEPPEFATLDENVATFQQAGTAVMKVQMGTYREEMEVTVSE